MYPADRIAPSELDARLRSVLDDEEDVLFAYLFGSVAKGRERRGSDVDVAVFLRLAEGRQPEDRALEVEASLERTVGRAVQVVVLNTVSLELAHTVLSSGWLITCRNDDARRSFYVTHGREYFDQAHAREIFRHYQRKRIEAGEFGD